MSKITTPTAIAVKALDNYMLELHFNNGEIKKYDVKSQIKGSWYGKLSDKDYFNKVFVDGFTVVWPDGQDLCPDDIYYLSEPVTNDL